MSQQKKQQEQNMGIAILDSGNYAICIIRTFEKKGIYFEFVPIPCTVGWNGCGYCIKFPLEYLDQIITEAENANTPVRAIYSIKPMFMKNKYTKIYENIPQKQR